jgi:hypothetical protein
VGAKFTEAIKSLWESGKALVAWFRADFLPGLERVKKFFGGWGNMFKVIAAMMAGPLVLALVAATKAVFALGAALMATPVGWVIVGIASVARAVYLIYKNWSKITEWLGEIWEPIPAFFDGLWEKVAGVFTEGLDALKNTLLGFSLADAGLQVVDSLLGGLKAAWSNVVKWFSEAWDSLTGWLPDSVKGRLGIKVDQPMPGGGGSVPSGPPTGAAAVMAGGAAAAPGRLPEQKVTTEVIITGENLPPGISVSAPRSQANKTRIDCGYMMAGV